MYDIKCANNGLLKVHIIFIFAIIQELIFKPEQNLFMALGFRCNTCEING